MKSYRTMSGYLLGLLLLASPVFAQMNGQRLNVDGIADAMGKQGTLSGEMYKVSFQRSDLDVRGGNIAIKPALALVGWADFIRARKTARTYGDLVLQENEVNPLLINL